MAPKQWKPAANAAAFFYRHATSTAPPAIIATPNQFGRLKCSPKNNAAKHVGRLRKTSLHMHQSLQGCGRSTNGGFWNSFAVATNVRFERATTKRQDI